MENLKYNDKTQVSQTRIDKWKTQQIKWQVK